MEKFNLNDISRDMPHSMPRKDLFETFPKQLFAKIEAENISPIPPSREPINLRTRSRIAKLVVRLSVVGGGVAAAIAVMLTIYVNSGVDRGGLAIEEKLVENVDSYLSSLSDEELSALLSQSQNQRNFYLNLPKF